MRRGTSGILQRKLTSNSNYCNSERKSNRGYIVSDGEKRERESATANLSHTSMKRTCVHMSTSVSGYCLAASPLDSLLSPPHHDYHHRHLHDDDANE